MYADRFGRSRKVSRVVKFSNDTCSGPRPNKTMSSLFPDISCCTWCCCPTTEASLPGSACTIYSNVSPWSSGCDWSHWRSHTKFFLSPVGDTSGNRFSGFQISPNSYLLQASSSANGVSVPAGSHVASAALSQSRAPSVLAAGRSRSPFCFALLSCALASTGVLFHSPANIRQDAHLL